MKLDKQKLLAHIVVVVRTLCTQTSEEILNSRIEVLFPQIL
jgi:hypothetical protein